MIKHMKNKNIETRKILTNTYVGCKLIDTMNCCGIETTPENALNCLNFWLKKVKQEGWKYSLENPQQIKSIKSLIIKISKLV